MKTLRQGVRRVALLQAVLTLMVAAVFGYVRGRFDFLSALYGGMVAVVVSGWLGLGVWRARGPGALFANAITRYGLAMLCLGVGLGVLKLVPLPLVAAFTVAQFGFLANVRQPTETPREPD